MSAKSKSDLTTENNNVVVSQSFPDSITPATLGGVLLQDIIDSMWNKVDDLLTLPPRSLTKAALAAEIGASSLNDKQWILITDRNDGNPLFVCSQLTNKISPYGIWVKAGVPLAVIMDYPNGHDGETNPFIAVFDENQKLNLPKQIVIADGSQSDNAVLTCDSNGKSTWKKAVFAQSNVENPSGMSGTGMKYMGLNVPITPAKTGNVLISVSGEYTSGTTVDTTRINIITGTGSPPSNGTDLLIPSGVTVRKILNLLASSSTLRIPFSASCIISLAVGTTYWIDLGLIAEDGSAVQIFNVSLTAIEQ